MQSLSLRTAHGVSRAAALTGQQTFRKSPVAPARFLAARASKDEDVSWSGLAKEAGSLARRAVGKIKDLVLPPSKPKEDDRSSNSGVPSYRSGGQESTERGLSSLNPFPGLMGRAVGSLIGAAVETLGKQVQAAAKDRDVVITRATVALQQSEALRRRMGPISVSSPVSQSMSSMNVNGKMMQRVNLMMPVQGQGGQVAMAQVSFASEAGGQSSCDIVVQLPSGETLPIKEGKGGGGAGLDDASGATIDVEFTEKR